MPIVPDDKNWTWVLERPCPECGFVAEDYDVHDTAATLRGNAESWPSLLARPNVAVRPTDSQWSALEYGCHVRDVFRLYHYRLDLMLDEDGPHFANWDQDVAAVEERYDLQDPATVAVEVVQAGELLAQAFESVRPDQWGRTGYRSDGVAFTIDTFARYMVHDPIHHLWDVHRGYSILEA